jgi:FkbM family methyltransferase
MAMPALSRVLRDVQSYFPLVRRAKFDTYNFLSHRFGLHVEPEFRLLKRLGTVDLALDIGGNWGQSIYALQRYARPRRIVSFEPNPALAANLHRIARSLGTVEVQPFGLSDAAGNLSLHVPRYRDYVYDGLASLDERSASQWLNEKRVWRFDRARLSIDRYEVDIRTLDSFGLRPDIVKIDVQGLETSVVRGGIETFRACRPVTIIETPGADLVALFADLGMHPYRLVEDRLVRDNLGGINTIFLSADRHGQLSLT